MMTSLAEQQTILAALRNAERDVDRLVAEHLLCAPDFRDWFVGSAGLLLDAGSLSVRSVRGGQRGDYGVDLLLTDGTNGSAVLVSNRLAPTRRQAESARKEAAAAVAEGRYKLVRLMLIRPESIERHCAEVDAVYDTVITHDWLHALFDTRSAAASGELSRRLAHHAAVVQAAVALGERALETASAGTLDDFQHDYLRLVSRELPDMPAAPAMVDGAGPDKALMVFPAAALPGWPFLPRMRLAHHLQEGAISLSFGGWGGMLADLAQMMEPTLGRTPYYIALGPKPSDSERAPLMLVEEVPVVWPERPIAVQEVNIISALRSIEQMRQWFAGQQTVVRYWAEVAGGTDPDNRISRYRRNVSLS